MESGVARTESKELQKDSSVFITDKTSSEHLHRP